MRCLNDDQALSLRVRHWQCAYRAGRSALPAVGQRVFLRPLRVAAVLPTVPITRGPCHPPQVFSNVNGDSAANNLAVLACGITHAAHALAAAGAEVPAGEGAGDGLRQLQQQAQQLLRFLADRCGVGARQAAVFVCRLAAAPHVGAGRHTSARLHTTSNHHHTTRAHPPTRRHREYASGKAQQQWLMSRASLLDLVHAQAASAALTA